MSSQISESQNRWMESLVTKAFNSAVSVWLRIVLVVVGAVNLLAPDLLKDQPQLRNGILITAAVGAGALLIEILARVVVAAIPSQIAFFILARKYGFAYEHLSITGRLKGDDGSMEIERRIRLRAYSPLNQVDHYLLSLAGSERRPVYKNFTKISPGWVKISVKESQPLPTQDRLVLLVNFDPPLHRGACAEYSIRESFPAGAFYTDRNQLMRAQVDEEFLVWAITRPTKRFQLRILLPNSLDPDAANCQHDVWYGGYSYVKHEKELRRLGRSFSQGLEPGETALFTNLDCKHPVLGLKYALKWRYK